MASSLAKAFSPRAIAIYGASATPGVFSSRPISMLRKHNYQGHIVPINPRRSDVAGIPCYASATDYDGQIDIALIVLRSERVEAALSDCSAAGIGVACILSSGFGEVGPDGDAAEQALVRARELGVRIIGPNCLGFINVQESVYAFAGHYDDMRAGEVALITQSGTVGSLLADHLHTAGVGIDIWLNTGNEADVTCADLLEAVSDRPTVRIVVLYIESLVHVEQFEHQIERLRSAGCEVIALKSGTSSIGQRATASHTGAMARSDELYSALFDACGIIRANSMQEVADCVAILATGPRPAGKAAIMTGSGAFGALAADVADDEGLALASITAKGKAEMRALVPYCATDNPIDPTASATDLGAREAFWRIVLDEPDVGYVVYTTGHGLSPFSPNGPERSKELVELAAGTPKRMLVASVVPDEIRDELSAGGVAVIASLDRAMRAIRRTIAVGSGLVGDDPAAASSATPSNVGQHQLPGMVISDERAFDLLAAAGIEMVPTLGVRSVDAALTAAAEVGYPLAIKVNDEGVSHKSDVGGVVLDIANDSQLRAAWQELAIGRDVVNAIVQPMVSGVAELIVGAIVDEEFGPHVVVGAGGLFTELVADTALARAPITEDEAERLIGKLRVAPLLNGARGRPPADVPAAAAIVAAVSRFVANHRDSLTEMELNPVIVREKGAFAVDALLVVRAGSEIGQLSPDPVHHSTTGKG